MKGAKKLRHVVSASFVVMALLAMALPATGAEVTEEWVARYDGMGNYAPWGDQATAIATAEVDGNVYVYTTGYSDGDGTGYDYYDYATVAYDSSGNELWVQRYNGPGHNRDLASAIATDSSGNVYVTGGSESYVPYQDYATIAYDSDGTQLWVARYGSMYHDERATAIAVTEVDGIVTVYVTGQGYRSSSSPENDYLTIAYDADGNQRWVQRYNGPANSSDRATAIATDSDGNVYVTGMSYNESNDDYATVAYDSDGNELWVQRYNGPGHNRDWAQAIATDNQCKVYVTGESNNGANQDYVTVAYDSDGTQIWVHRYNGPGNNHDWAHAIATHGNDVYVTGSSIGSGTGYDYATIKLR